MENNSFEENMLSFDRWRGQLQQAIETYHAWRKQYGLSDVSDSASMLKVKQTLMADRITLAFVAEFSRGKTELINALFFSQTGVRLLPSSPGRTTMCPTELFYDANEASYIRLLDIESRLDDASLDALKEQKDRWVHLDLDCDSMLQMQTAFKELHAEKQVSINDAVKLGLFNEEEYSKTLRGNADTVEIPRWRHALVNFPHPLLKKGLTILDTPGLNALGSEPELTLNMLPNAQAIVFLVAADTGVTKSDMGIWCDHIAKTSKQGRAVVLNKIDTFWDDLLSSDDEYQDAINAQLSSVAKLLNISADVIFPVSAKQALIAKIRGDADLLKRSRIAGFEAYLSQCIFQQRQALLMDMVVREIGFLFRESVNLIEFQYSRARDQLQEFKQLDVVNRELIGQLIQDTQDEQVAYFENLAAFKKSRKEFTMLQKKLVNSMSQKKVDALIMQGGLEMMKSLSTYGMKQCMRKLFDDLRNLLQETVMLTLETQVLVRTIYKQFHDEHGFQVIEPRLFSIAQYHAELDQLFDASEVFRLSTQVTLMEQSVVVKKLYNTLLIQARTILGNAHEDALKWGRNVMSPLAYQIMGYKRQIETRLAVLNSLMKSKDSLHENLDKLEQDLLVILNQRNALDSIIKKIEGESSLFSDSLTPIVAINDRRKTSA
ncbi:hypothetical protein MGMO_27c00180 [Methyloglobulus morosus KoM1]|uniref:Dynamin N-terminal domain-containing protein n=1 Tax=Methyloglobulus morosus KoM1 TaxID=1116472 RepID=V5BIY6_9GAMM|nr:dynamin family protein [Methyloglobulus morosus]ESS73275.1 hypothetical protein MGMO_27c00180 [Methyloglobulus morosus KoM1]